MQVRQGNRERKRETWRETERHAHFSSLFFSFDRFFLELEAAKEERIEETRIFDRFLPIAFSV
jgi:hypothetical protein